MPQRSVVPAIPPLGAGSRKTKGAGVDHGLSRTLPIGVKFGLRQETQTGTRRSRSEPRTDRSLRWRPVPTVNPIHWHIQSNRVMLVLDDEYFRADSTRLDWTVALEGGAAG